MLKYLCALGYCLLVSLAFTDAEIAVRAPVGGTFRLHMFPLPLDNPTSCSITNPQNVVTVIPLDYQVSDDQINIQKIEPLGNGQCGARIHDVVARNDQGRWTLSLADGIQNVSEIYRINTIAWEVPTNRTTSAVIGTAGMVLQCGPSNNMLYCEMRDPYGNLAWLSHRTRCQTTIHRLTASHFGVWSCTVAVVGGSSEIYATHTLQMQETANEITIFTNETSLGKMISWQVHGLSGTSLWCRAFLPNGETIMVLPGMDSETHISVSTDLNEHKCGLLIAGDFSEDHHGLWRLEIGVNNRRAMGGFIKMPEGEVPGVEDRPTARNESISHEIVELNVVAREPFRIECSVPYPASYCWIGGPLGEEYTQSENLTVGRCSQAVNSSNAENHTGIWTCNIASVYGGPEEQFVTRVNVVENLFESMYPEVKVTLGNKAVIACRSVLGYALEYCRFIRPDGKRFSVFPGVNSFDRYSYEGPGLIYGYCGLAISSVEKVDIGEWRCASRSLAHMWELESWGTSILQFETIVPHASSSWVPQIIVGLVIGTVLMLLAVVSVVVVRQYGINARRDSRVSQETVIVKSSS